MRTKCCTKCNKVKPLSEFGINNDYIDKLQYWCKKCINLSMITYNKAFPWKKIFTAIKQRCNNPKNPAYKDYGKRGIKCLITEQEIKELWFRDKAAEMKCATIDRINNDGNYTFDNCQFIEKIENTKKAKIKSIIQYDLQGNFIKEWESTTTASRELNICRNSIWSVLKKLTFTAGNFKWGYKDEQNT